MFILHWLIERNSAKNIKFVANRRIVSIEFANFGIICKKIVRLVIHFIENSLPGTTKISVKIFYVVHW